MIGKRRTMVLLQAWTQGPADRDRTAHAVGPLSAAFPYRSGDQRSLDIAVGRRSTVGPMQIGALAIQLGTTPNAIRFYERSGLLPRAERGANGYRQYDRSDAERLRLLIGLRQLDLALDQAAELAGLCAAGRCDEVSAELRVAIREKRTELRQRMEDMAFLDQRLAHLEGGLIAEQPPGPLITLGTGSDR